MKSLIAFAILMMGSIAYSVAGDVWVNDYYRKDGTHVDGYYRSSPNAYNWDNKSYTPSQPAYNNSFGDTSRKTSSDWYTPSETRFNDSNPYNDVPSNSEKKRPLGWELYH